MTPFLQLIFLLAVLILAAKLGGYLSLRLGQPSVLGELLVGILLGPSLIDVLHLPAFTDTHLPEVIHHLAEIGVLLLMFIAGLELHLSELARSTRVAALAGSLGVVVPLVMGAGLGLLLGLDFSPALFIGLILSATSVSISAQTLMELNVLRSRVGYGLLGAAVFDDILVVLGLSIFVALGSSGGGVGSIVMILVRMLAFLGVGGLFGFWVLPRLTRLAHRLPVSQALISFTFVTMLLYAWFSEAFGGMAAITGSFLAGLMFSRSSLRERILNGISPLAYAVFVPIFFVNVGLSADARQLAGGGIWLLVSMLVVAIIGKVAGSGVGALMAGMSRREALQLGVGMMSRGEVGLIVASVGITQGLVDDTEFAAVVGVVILTTLLTPPALRALFAKPAPEPAPTGSQPAPHDAGRHDSALPAPAPHAGTPQSGKAAGAQSEAAGEAEPVDGAQSHAKAYDLPDPEIERVNNQDETRGESK